MSTLALITVFLLTALGQNVQQPTASETTHYPNVLHAELPLYPPLASTMRINGTVKIEVTVEKGAVVDATVKSTEIEFSDPQKNALYDSDAKKKIANQFLSNPSLANLKTWQFRSEDRATFVVTYIYKIEGEETPLPENPKVELDLPRLVKVTARPFKPTCSDCGAQIRGGNGAATLDPKNGNPLCSLQQTVAEGNRESVLVSGVFSEGPEVGTLEDATCPKETTWVELALRSDQNKEKLRKVLDRSHRAYVVVEGEFYGSPLPDPKLPEAIRKSYHPGWGHLAAFKTKLVVHAIRDVKPAPTDNTNGASLNHEAKHAEGMFASVDQKDGSLHLEIPVVASAKPKQP